MNTKLYDRAFITGADANTVWMVPWFLDNYKKHNSDPIIFADFGVGDRDTVYNTIEPYVHAIMDMTKIKARHGWFKKPNAIYRCPAKKICWLDSDVEVREDISGIWDLLVPNKLNMVKDRPWEKRRGGVQFNSGVVGVIGQPLILGMWQQWINDGNEVGDQETLTANLNPITQMTYINELPNEYNWLRLQIENDGQPADKAKVVHWTGQKGKERIKALIHG